MTRAFLALAVAAGLALAPSANAATSFELGTGSHPDVDVDAAGTAHIVVDLPDDKLRYCQIPRGQTACTVDQTLAPPVEAIGRSSFVFVPSPNRVVIVTKRCCPPDAVLAYQSTDNGATFAGPTQIGNISPRDAVFGPGDAVSGIETSGYYQRMSLTGPATSDRAELPAGFTVPTGSTLALLDGTRPLKVSADGANTTFSLQSGAGDQNSAATWGSPTPITPAGGDPHLASGAGGAVLIYRVEGELHARKWNGSGFDPATVLSTGDPIQADVTSDASGRYTAVWTENNVNPNEIRISTSADGATWSTPELLLRGDAVDGLFNTQVATAPDGQGFMVFDANRSDGPITVSPLDPRASLTGGDPAPGSGGPKPLATTTVNGTRISFFGPTSCVQSPANIVLRVTSKRKRQLSPRRRVKIGKVVFSVDRKKKTDKKKAFRKSFTTRGMKRGSRHKVGAVVRLAPVKKGAFKAKTKRLKGRFRICS